MLVGEGVGEDIEGSQRALIGLDIDRSQPALISCSRVPSDRRLNVILK